MINNNKYYSHWVKTTLFLLFVQTNQVKELKTLENSLRMKNVDIKQIL